jgi:hypothetical protein
MNSTGTHQSGQGESFVLASSHFSSSHEKTSEGSFLAHSECAVDGSAQSADVRDGLQVSKAWRACLLSNTNNVAEIEKELDKDKAQRTRLIKKALIEQGVFQCSQEDLYKSRLDGRIINCGRKSIKADVDLILRKSGKVATSNLMMCGNIWKCTSCRDRLLAKKCEDVIDVSQKTSGNSLMLVTFTVSHSRKNTLRELHDAVNGSFRKLRQSHEWRAIKSDYDYDWDVRNLETTYGNKNGWHFHIHVLVSFKKSLTDRDISAIKYTLWTVWKKYLEGYNFSCNFQNGVDCIRAENASKYLTKWNIGKEMVGGGKSAKGDNLSIGDMEKQVLIDSLKSQKADFRIVSLLREFYRVFSGKKFLVSGGKFNEILGSVDTSKSEVDAAGQDDDSSTSETKETKITINSFFWNGLVKKGIAYALITWIEKTDDLSGIHEFLVEKLVSSGWDLNVAISRVYDVLKVIDFQIEDQFMKNKLNEI